MIPLKKYGVGCPSALLSWLIIAIVWRVPFDDGYGRRYWRIMVKAKVRRAYREKVEIALVEMC